MVNHSQIKPYEVHCLGSKGEFWVVLGDRGQRSRRKRRRYKKALKTMSLAELLEIVLEAGLTWSARSSKFSE